MFTPVKTLPEGSIFYTDLAGVSVFAAWLDAFEVLLHSHQRLATVCAPMRLQKEETQIVADRKLYLDWIRAHQPLLADRCAAMLLIEPDAEQLALMRQQSGKMAPALGVNYIVEADYAAALASAQAALAAFQPEKV
ncbi:MULTISPECIES: extensin [Eikenella]|uniref:Extensin n=1 Tax=Eikenella longinqua TaxID=1795827 RepID=A0A1A9RZE8_9NEIS|nr:MULTISPECIES: extensin [Eikenella]OAM29394.1 extensin [Eikenella longinqua]